MSYPYEEDEWYERRRYGDRHPSPRRPYNEHRRSAQHLNLDPYSGGSSLHRTRSTGHGPTPVVNVYNDVYQDSNLRADQSRSPPYPPTYPPPSPSLRGRRSPRLGDEFLIGEMAGMELERRRSRSRGRSDAPEMYQYELMKAKQELEQIERRRAWEKEEERIKAAYELKIAKDEVKRKAEANKRKEEEEEEAESKKRWISDYEKKKREDAEKAKAAEVALIQKLDREAREKKEKEKKEYEEFLLKQKEEKEKKERERKEEEEKIEQAMRNRLRKYGFAENQIEVMVKEEKAKTITPGALPIAPIGWPGQPAPVYAKVHRDFLSVETLIYYDIPYEYDRNDPNYIIILREMDKHETDVLFEHTRRVRGKTLLIEEKKEKKPHYAWARKRSKSAGRRDIKVLEIIKR